MRDGPASNPNTMPEAIPGTITCEAVRDVFDNQVPKEARSEILRLKVGPASVRLVTSSDVVERWLLPALAGKLASWETSMERDFDLRIVHQPELPEQERLCSWVDQGKRDGLHLEAGSIDEALMIESDSRFWAYWSADNRDAFVWIPDLNRLAAWEKAAPIKALLHGISSAFGMQLLHGGGVGTKQGGVLLAGPGGAGKSTTAICCIGSNLKYLADDYCLLDQRDEPTLHNLYTSAKLRPENLHRFQHIRDLFSWEPTQLGSKPTIFVHERFAQSTIDSFPIRALVVPNVTGEVDTTWERCRVGDAWRAIAPSTIAQLPLCERKAFDQVSRLIHRLPTYRLHSGTDLSRIPQRIEEIIADATQSASV